MPFSESRMYGRRHYPVRNQTASLTTTCQKVSKSTIFGAPGRIADFESLRLQMAGFPTHVDIASWLSPNETRNCRTCSEAVQLPSWQSGISSLEICSKGGFVISCKGPRDVHAPQKHGSLLRSTDSNATDVIGSLNSKNKPTCHQCNQGRDLFLDLDIFERWSITLPSAGSETEDSDCDFITRSSARNTKMFEGLREGLFQVSSTTALAFKSIQNRPRTSPLRRETAAPKGRKELAEVKAQLAETKAQLADVASMTSNLLGSGSMESGSAGSTGESSPG
ncbi:hypothetical protein BGZ57DRAFT_921208 [Hyaloscypha finlandica]|nr:hypothetical protein BGZ57DRAFT_921208 [Hyaloscypha finlandica]